MADYGHELLFGTFITPQNRRPDDVVALAQLTEQAGLDFATFQDHPYQPAFLDTWTLMSWVAARTSTLRVSANVLNLPLRPPAVTARAAASLDLLSGGRFELGLGAGAFWDAIAGMTGQRLTAGQAVDALDEAIDIIRGIWDVSQRGGLRVNGRHHRAEGAKRGPEPAHPIQIWLGAYKPRMLALTGAKADGWLPSWPYMTPEDVAPGNRLIDRAARDAGRDPREIRRLLNLPAGRFGTGTGFLQGPPEAWVEDLLPLVTRDGFSAFFLMGDDPELVAGFGNEVAPALREAVAEHRERAGTDTGPVRPARSLARRREGIDYEGLPASLADVAVEPGDHGYAKVRSTYMRPGSPGLVLRPRGVAEVRESLAYARRQSVELSVRSGGHGVSGRSTNDGGIVIDVGHLNRIELLDAGTGRVRLEPGARWGEVARALAPHGLGMSSGDFGDVGVGGLATAGGIGFMARLHGLTIDHVVAAELVLADGTFVRADAEHHPDLLWAVRGAGGNFGIVTALELEAYPVGDVVFSTMTFDASSGAAGLLEAWGRAVEESPRELTSFLNLVGARDGAYVQLYSVYAGADTEAAVEALVPLAEVGRLVDQAAHLVPYHLVVRPQDAEHDPAGTSAFRAALLDHVTPDAARLLEEGLRSRAAGWLQIRSVGGAVNDVDPMATAYAHRTQNFSLNAITGRLRADRLDALWDDLAPHRNGLYLSFEGGTGPERLAEAFPGEHLARLRRLKRRYDPGNVFDRNFPIPPADADGDDGDDGDGDAGGASGGAGVA